jgi:putative N-acetylmannosamine-6-phosphate epimerase
MAAMAKAAEIGGAVGIRANSPQDIRAIRAVSRLPIIGLYKVFSPDTEVYFTPDFKAVAAVQPGVCGNLVRRSHNSAL